MKRSILFGLVLIWAFPSMAQADIFNYGSVESDTVFFNDIEEISSTSTDAVYGAPTEGFDSISFTSLGFQAFANGGFDFEEGRLTFTIEAKDGFFIESVEFESAGSFLLFGDDATVTASSSGVADVNGTLFTGSDVAEMQGSDFSGRNTFNSNFEIQIPNATELTFVLDSQVLAAAVSASEFGTLSQNVIVVRVNSRAIPEPTTLGLLFLAGGTVAVRRRR